LDKHTFQKLETYMHTCMKDGAHDKQHIYRVLYYCLDIAKSHVVDKDVLITSALLHDIGREAQFKNPKLDHAVIGSEMAYEFLVRNEFAEEKAVWVRECISTHRYRKNHEPESIEAKILFDADKLDVTGTIGIARTLAYKGIVSEPFYSIDESGNILDGTRDESPSFFQEYQFKLKNVYDHFYTEKAKEIALSRKSIADLFYSTMMGEVTETYKNGQINLENEFKS
jgi:uncharacterized protein